MPSSVGVRTSCCIATQVRRRRTDNKRRTDLNAAVLVRSTKPLLIKEIILSFFYVVAPSVGRRTLCCVATQVRRRGTDSKRRVNLNAAVLVRSTKPLLKQVKALKIECLFSVPQQGGARTLQNICF